MNGKGLLKFASVFMVIWGILNIFIGTSLVIGFGAAKEVMPDVKEELMAAAIVLFIAIGLVELIAARVGFGAVKDARKTTKCLIMGFIVVSFQIGTTLTGDLSNVNVASLIAPLAIPVIYIVGAFIRKSNPSA